MIFKISRINWIGEYQKSDLKSYIQVNNGNNPQPDKDFELEKEIQNALQEKDIMQLRAKLYEIVKPAANNNSYFELFEDFTTIDDLNLNMPQEELLDPYDSMPKVHLYQHKISEKETIHRFYKEQMRSESSGEYEYENDEFELEGLEEAILEKDIIDLRNKLSRVSEIVSLPYSPEEIEQYVAGEMNAKQAERFTKELSVNSALRAEAQLYNQVNKAIRELDINNLRQKLTDLMAMETSWNVSEEIIEGFIDGRLEGEELEKFRAEYNENTGLKAEVKLRKELNEAVGEKDIIELKEKLQAIHKDAKTKEIKSLIPNHKKESFYWWRAGVAVAIVFFLISGLFRFNIYNPDQTYSAFYQPPEWSNQRSVVRENTFLTEAGEYFSKGDFIRAIKSYDAALLENSDQPLFYFYKAVSLQNLGQFEPAADHYSKVILHGDNLFIEEAEWYKSLCYIKMNDTGKAKEQLLRIVERKGYYANDAKAVLRKMRYTFN